MALHVDMKCDVEALLNDRPGLVKTRCVNRGLNDAEHRASRTPIFWSWGSRGPWRHVAVTLTQGRTPFSNTHLPAPTWRRTSTSSTTSSLHSRCWREEVEPQKTPFGLLVPFRLQFSMINLLHSWA